MKVRVEYRYANDNAYCRDFVCDDSHIPTPGMKVRALVSYSTLVSIQQTRIDGDGLKHYVGLIEEDGGKSSNEQTYYV